MSSSTASSTTSTTAAPSNGGIVGATPTCVNAVPVEFPPVVRLPIAPPSRVKIGLVMLFSAVYAIGAIVMAVQFSNAAAASGFGITALMCAMYTVLLKHTPERIQHCTFLSITRQGLFLFGGLSVVFLGVGVYWLVTGIQAHEALNGASKFCGFMSYLMACKWAVACALRVRFFRSVAQQHIRRGVVITPGIPIPSSAVVEGGVVAVAIASDAAGACPYLTRLQQEQQKLLP